MRTALKTDIEANAISVHHHSRTQSNFTHTKPLILGQSKLQQNK